MGVVLEHRPRHSLTTLIQRVQLAHACQIARAKAIFVPVSNTQDDSNTHRHTNTVAARMP